MQHWELLIFFFAVAFIYSSVGFGGGSSYLALLAIYGLPVYDMKLIGLVCNIIVVTGGSILFIRHRQADLKKILPIILLSVPLAFLGARIKMSTDAFFLLLGCSLIAAALMLAIKTRDIERPVPQGPLASSLLGGAIGFLSGMVSIGGGIFLAPLLHLIRWDVPRKIAATASVFILVNSISALVAHLWQPVPHDVQYSRILLLCVAVLAGGQLGSRIGVKRLNPLAIRRVTALLVFAAGVEVLVKHLHGH